jgi:hypothetical protein
MSGPFGAFFAFEIQQMEQDFKKSSLMFESSSISNNLYYNNPKGA